MKRALIVAAALSLSIVPVTTAHATFPGGNGKIVYNNGGTLFVMQPNGSGVTRITPCPACGVDSPVWSPDGTKIAFLRIVIPGFVGYLQVMNADGSGRTTILKEWGKGVDLFSRNGIAWSPNGKALAFTAPPRARPNSESTHIFTVHIDGTHLRDLTKNHGTQRDSEPAWSPDRTKIAFVESGIRKGSVIKTMSPDGSSRKLIVQGSYNNYPNWSPDGTQIVFQRETNAGLTDINIVNANGTARKNLTLTTTRAEWTPVFSPDGTKILFSKDPKPPDPNAAEKDDLWKMNLDGTSLTRITNTPLIDEYDADWQPI